MLNISTKKKYEEKKRKGRERKRLSKMRKLEQIGQLSPAPTREETKTEETETWDHRSNTKLLKVAPW